MLLGFDPGRDKCGIAVMGQDQQIHYHQVVSADTALETIARLRQTYPISLLVIGDQTTTKQWQTRLNQALTPPLPITTVDERFSTLAARERYWQMYPPQGLQRFVPQGMREPPRPVDDIVAIVLLERYLAAKTGSES
jgi:RNase H-fold protein (predicted Holliday junction resolvase)